MLSPNETEAEALCGRKLETEEDFRQAARFLRKESCAEYVLFKLGGKGALLYDGKEYYAFPAQAVSVKDTTGAGDNFMAALAVEYIRSKDMHRAVRCANAAAAICVTRAGSQTSFAAAEEMNGQLKNRNRFSLHG